MLFRSNGTGSLKLQTGGSTKLEVTSAGIDVTGTVAMDGGSTSADFTFADFKDANLNGANLGGSSFVNADLTGANLIGARVNDKTDFRGAVGLSEDTIAYLSNLGASIS